MYRYYLTNKWVLSAIGFLIVLSVACVLWYKHDTSADRQAATDAENQLSQLEATQTAASNNVTKDGTKAPAESTASTAEKPITKTTEGNVINIHSDDPSVDIPAKTHKTVNVEEMRVSPYGFGPYPEIPDGYPHDKPFYDDMGMKQELIARVRIKLYKERGIFPRGIGIDNSTGLVQFLTEDQIYIDWNYTTDDKGNQIKYASSLTTLPSIAARIHDNATIRDPNFMEGDMVLESDIPNGILVLSTNEGIDPYQFLGLPKK